MKSDEIVGLYIKGIGRYRCPIAEFDKMIAAFAGTSLRDLKKILHEDMVHEQGRPSWEVGIYCRVITTITQMLVVMYEQGIRRK
jgi:hypothetical protein